MSKQLITGSGHGQKGSDHPYQENDDHEEVIGVIVISLVDEKYKELMVSHHFSSKAPKIDRSTCSDVMAKQNGSNLAPSTRVRTSVGRSLYYWQGP